MYPERRGREGERERIEGPIQGKRNIFNILTVPLHDLEELDNDLGAGADKDLPLATLLSVVDGLQAVAEDADADHSGG